LLLRRLTLEEEELRNDCCAEAVVDWAIQADDALFEKAGVDVIYFPYAAVVRLAGRGMGELGYEQVCQPPPTDS
jgi:hypothetical protein